MATYKVVDADQLDADMTALANTIRTKGGTSGKLAWPAGYQSAVMGIETGKDVSSVTATAADVVKPKVFVDKNGNQVTGTLEPVIRHEGEFVVSYDADWNTYVECGFKPDAVMFPDIIDFPDTGEVNTWQAQCAVLFPESTPGTHQAAYGYVTLDTHPGQDLWFSIEIVQTATGFIVNEFGFWDESGNWVSLAGQTWRYVAVKYTESIPAEFDTSVITATPADVVAPKVFIDKDGVTRAGTLKVQTYYYGADEPSATTGADGDLYFVMG